MTATDIVLIAALSIFVTTWWIPALPRRTPILLISALVSLAAAAWGYFDGRWQAIAGGGVALLFLLVFLLGRKRKTGVPIVSGALLILLTLGAVLPLYLFPVSPLPAPSGPHAVGVRAFELSDAFRPGIFLAGPDEPRRLLIKVWYPAQPSATDRRAHYFTPAEARTTARGLGSLIRFEPLLSHLKLVRANAYQNAALRPGASKRPVVVYSHGYMSFAGQNTALMEDLASHGYIVYAIQHTYDASTTVFPNGGEAPMDDALKRSHDDKRPQGMNTLLTGTTLDERLSGYSLLQEQDTRMIRQSAPVWVVDRGFLLDRLASGSVPAEIAQIAVASDTSRTGQIGMSFGGSTTGGFCLVDTRCAAGVNLDGLSYHLQTVDTDMPVPFLMLHSDMTRFQRRQGDEAPGAPQSFNQFSYESLANAGQLPHVYRFQVNGAQHMGFSDFTLFIRRPLADMFLGTVPAATMIELQNDVVRGFFDRHVRGLENGFPATELTRYRESLTALDNSNVRKWWQAKPSEEQHALAQWIDALHTGAGDLTPPE